MPTISETLVQAKAYHRAGQLPDALQLYQQVLQADAANVEAHFLLGIALHGLGQANEAVASLTQAIRLQPDHAEAHNHLGAVLTQLGKLDEAIARFQQALTLRPGSAEISHNLRFALATKDNGLGNIRTAEGDLDEAAACYRRAVERKPDFAEAHYNLGAVMARQGRFGEAANCYRRAIELKPDYAEAWYNLANAAVSQNQLDAAETCYRRVLELRPDYADGHYNHALALLLMGRFQEAWPEYEWRWKRKGKEEPILPQSHWTGDALAGRTIMLYSEQGLGDMLQFIRYAELVKQQGGTVIAEVAPVLTSLVARCPGVDRVVAAGGPVPKFDVRAWLLSLPGIFRTSLETIPAKVPYLSPAEELVQKWKHDLGSDTGFKVGIAWQGNPAYAADRVRSIPLARFAGLARLRGVRLYSLQMGPGREQLAELASSLPITDLGDRLGDFHNTAAIMRNLDLVISCDSAPVHLAGALGMRVWVALAFAPDWRWMLGQTDSPWYPTMRLFRQNTPGDWESVFQRIEAELARLV